MASAATPEGTKGYFSTHPNMPTVVLGRTGWTVSPVGFGSYRIHEKGELHAESLRQALATGCNLIDTSANYGDGGSERVIGRVLAQLIHGRGLEREHVVVVTKAGYIQGENLRIAREREAGGRPFPETVKVSDQCWHSIHPEFLEDQITRSLERLGLERIDVLLLHNPEYFLHGSSDHAEYYRRIGAAFAHLEHEVARGRIQWYGVSSNTLPDARESARFTSLETLWELAEKSGPGQRFGVVQFPFNLYEPGAAFETSNSGKTVCEVALLRRLGTLTNRPLNAFVGNQLVRLADFPAHPGHDTETELKEALQAAMEHETSYPEPDSVPVGRVAWGHILHRNAERLADLETWREVLGLQAQPALEEALGELTRRGGASARWAELYRPLAARLLAAFTAYLEASASERSRRIAETLERACPVLRTSKTLSRKAIRVYRSIPGLHCVLVGMRRPEYVTDALHGFEAPLGPEQAYDALDAVYIEASKTFHSHAAEEESAP
jgi:hypothetical protein